MVNKAKGHDCNAVTKLFTLYDFSNNICGYLEKYNVFQVRFSNISIVVFVVRFALTRNFHKLNNIITEFIKKHL